VLLSREESEELEKLKEHLFTAGEAAAQKPREGGRFLNKTLSWGEGGGKNMRIWKKKRPHGEESL